MISTTIDRILCFWVLIRWKWVIFFSLWNPLELGTVLILNYFQLKLGTFLIFRRPPPPKCQIPKFRCFFDWKASLSWAIKSSLVFGYILDISRFGLDLNWIIKMPLHLIQSLFTLRSENPKLNSKAEFQEQSQGVLKMPQFNL